MRGGFPIGEIIGIDIRIDWSWLLILGLVTWNLSTAFGQLHPNWSTAAQWGLGLVAALLFFASVLGHELAHSLVAKARGVPVPSITLHLFGGVSNIREGPHSPLGEFLLAIVGPLTSIILGILLVAAISLTTGSLTGQNAQSVVSALGAVPTLVLWLGSVNILVGIFNLIPGVPAGRRTHPTRDRVGHTGRLPAGDLGCSRGRAPHRLGDDRSRNRHGARRAHSALGHRLAERHLACPYRVVP